MLFLIIRIEYVAESRNNWKMYFSKMCIVEVALEHNYLLPQKGIESVTVLRYLLAQ